jgi:hypothetical protein
LAKSTTCNDPAQADNRQRRPETLQGQLISETSPNEKLEGMLKASDPPDTSVEGQLAKYRLQYQTGVQETEHKHFTEVSWRLFEQT